MPSSFRRQDDELNGHPYAVLGRLRAEAPISWTDDGGGYWVVVSHALAREVLTRPDVFSSRWGTIPPSSFPVAPEIPLHTDPPEHGRYRQVLKAFLDAGLGPSAAPLGHDLGRTHGRAFAEAGGGEFVGVAEAIAHEAFWRHFDVPEDAAEHLRPPDPVAGNRDGGPYAETLVLARRTRQVRVLHDAVRSGAYTADGPAGERLAAMASALTPAEFVGMARLLHGAAVDTVAAQLALSVHHLAADPGLRRRLRTDGVTPEAVDELIRFDSPIAVVRQADERVELGGRAIEAGQMVLVFVNAANRDEAVFPDPDRVRPDRPGLRQHLGFGAGVHRCPGAAVGRTLLAGVIAGFHTACPAYRLCPDDSPVFRFNPLRGLVSLPLRVP